ncbi:MAG TPA: MerR family transcriptional regulator [Oceanospirillaceae bacterium]|nr:MerR family transcriptional regulator [Oceanospirillaceae bacterium]
MNDVVKPSLKQNPHAIRGEKERKLEVAIGREVRSLRKAIGITGADLATSCGVSVGMLSKIENGLISPSLTTLQALAHALGVPLTYLMRKFEEQRTAVQVKSGEGVEMERRGTRSGHQYNLLGYLADNDSGVMVEPYMITLTDVTDEFPAFQHEGVEYLYFLEGRAEYRHGDRTYLMEPGDSLFFDADAPHGPEKLLDFPVRYLSVISYPKTSSKSSF